MTELWLPISGFERAYEVSDEGRIRSLAGQYAGRIFRGRTARNGYLYFDLCANGEKARFLVHRLVAIAHIGPAPDDSPWINHRDGNKRNNRVTNLEWVSPSENNAHAYRSGLKKPTDARGERNPRAKLTREQVHEIRSLSGTVSQRHLAARYGVSKSTIQWIQKGRNWPADLRVQEFPR